MSRLLRETGRYSSTPVFVVGIFSGKEQLGEGFGSSLKMAEYRVRLPLLCTQASAHPNQGCGGCPPSCLPHTDASSTSASAQQYFLAEHWQCIQRCTGGGLRRASPYSTRNTIRELGQEQWLSIYSINSISSVKQDPVMSTMATIEPYSTSAQFSGTDCREALVDFLRYHWPTKHLHKQISFNEDCRLPLQAHLPI